MNLNITPLNKMDATYAKKITGGEDLDITQKKQIQEQQQVSDPGVIKRLLAL